MSDYLVPLLLVTAAFLCIFLAFVISNVGVNNDKFNRFANACNAAGGQLSVTFINDDGNPNYECFKNDKQIQVPGFPGY